jgi:hypothetical protein
MFISQIPEEERQNLKSQFATSSWGGRRTNPYAFTGQCVAMFSGVLNSETAIQLSPVILLLTADRGKLNITLAHH